MISDTTPLTSARLQQISIRIVFFIAGLGMAAWAPLVPFAKARIGINDGMLGLLLLCLGIGSILAMPFAGAFTARVGCRRSLSSLGSPLLWPQPHLTWFGTMAAGAELYSPSRMAWCYSSACSALFCS